jgi:hypothetical protein
MADKLAAFNRHVGANISAVKRIFAMVDVALIGWADICSTGCRTARCRFDNNAWAATTSARISRGQWWGLAGAKINPKGNYRHFRRVSGFWK